MADPVGFDSTTSAGAVSSSASGLIAYRVIGASRRQLVWFDRAGKTVGNVGPPDEAGLSSPRLSPDDRRVAAYRTVQGNADIWMLDGSRISRFTFDAALDRYPIWSADGSRIVFDSNRKGTRDLYMKPSSGAGSEELLLESSENKGANDWSKDGRFFVYSISSPKTGWDVWILSLEGERKPWRFLETNFNERSAQFSPDGRWVAYVSDESGRYEVYVRAFIASDAAGSGSGANQAGGQWQVSTAGGIFARWRADGQELFYVAPDGRMMAAPIGVTEGALVPGTPVALFSSPMYGGGASPDLGRQYDVSRDGRFLINTVLDEAAAPITILQNWNPEDR